jgi:hypothetical protein
MGLLATLPRATRGHLGAANDSLTRATRGYLQDQEVVVRRPGGGLFAPEIEVEVEFFRQHESRLQLHLDGASDFALHSADDAHEILTGRLWLNGHSLTRLSERAIPLRAITSPSRTPPALRTATPITPTRLQPARSLVNVTSRRVAGTAGVVVALQSAIRVGKAPRPTFPERTGGALWLDGASRFRPIDLGLPQEPRTKDQIAIIAAMLAEILDG